MQKGWGAGEGERVLPLEAGIELIPNSNICFCFIQITKQKKRIHTQLYLVVSFVFYSKIITTKATWNPKVFLLF